MEKRKQWIINTIPDEKVDVLSEQLKISHLLSKVFLSRGIEDKQYIKQFINPSMDDLYDPFLFKDMEKAVNRIIKAVKDKEKILIFGDYDVDGITSTSICMIFSKNGASIGHYIPDREEG